LAISAAQVVVPEVDRIAARNQQQQQIMEAQGANRSQTSCGCSEAKIRQLVQKYVRETYHVANARPRVSRRSRAS
jgi:hypothetical protein